MTSYLKISTFFLAYGRSRLKCNYSHTLFTAGLPHECQKIFEVLKTITLYSPVLFRWMQRMGVSDTELSIFLWSIFFELYQFSETWTCQTSFSICFSHALSCRLCSDHWRSNMVAVVCGYLFLSLTLALQKRAEWLLWRQWFWGTGLKLGLSQTISGTSSHSFSGFASSSPLDKHLTGML